MDLRELVLDTLLETEEGKIYSHMALRNLLDKHAELDKQKRAFLTREIEGTLERRYTIDAMIDQYSKHPVKKMKPVIRNIMRIAVYELFFMDSIPAAVAINEAVNLTERRGFYNLKPFVNGVLRTIERNRSEFDFTDPTMLYSMPKWIVKLLEEEHGAEAMEEILQASLLAPPMTIRLNYCKGEENELLGHIRREAVEIRPADFPGAYYISNIDRLQALVTFREGFFHMMDLSSQMAMDRVETKPGMKILDACAAPGGKSMFFYSKLRGDVQITACDLTENKTAMLWENFRRMGATAIRVRAQDALIFAPELEKAFDLVVADLPCSGLGVMSRKVDLKYRMTKEQIAELADLQHRMLENLKRYVAPGGQLIYSTCTITHVENEENTARFLAESPEFSLVSEEQILPKPHICDGFYYALLRRA